MLSDQPPKATICVSWICPVKNEITSSYALVNGFPTLLFIVFLSWGLRRAVRKLRRTHSLIMLTYYTFLWAVSVLNTLRCIVLLAEAKVTGNGHWNSLWLLTGFAMVLLEVSVVVFLLQGYEASGGEALLRTVTLSGTLALGDTVIKALILRSGVPLFLYGGDEEHGVLADMRWSKWGFWMAHSLLFLSLYAALLALPFTKWRDRLPAKPSFYRYVFLLFCYNALRVLGSLLIAAHVQFGYCIYGAAAFLYAACYPPLLYITFLHDFLSDSELDDELGYMYMEEMVAAGYEDSYGRY